jgi:hypothetical protein
MIVFWSWQSDTPGNVGRYFIRDALRDAIKVLKSDKEIVEPSEREARDALKLDQDRQGVPGSPDLAATIFRKIDQATVFVADVTTTGATTEGKKLINSNVAIEYGHAHHALGDTSILMVQNTHYGDRNDLPFDLRHKAGPIQFTLPSDATKQEITVAQTALKQEFVTRLRPYLLMKPAAQGRLHAEVPSTYSKAAFFGLHDVLVSVAAGTVDEAGLTFDGRQAFYLRLLPYYARTKGVPHADLVNLGTQSRIDLPVRQLYGGAAGRNRHGVVVFEMPGSVREPRALTQAFPNGELWAVTNELFVHHGRDALIPTTNVFNIFCRVLRNFVSISNNEFANGLPIVVVLGAVGLDGFSLPMGQPNPLEGYAGPIHQNELELRERLDDPSEERQERLVDHFVRELYDLAGVRVGSAPPWRRAAT